MPRKTVSAAQSPVHDWFLRDWMRTLRVKQAELARRTGWSIATVNDIYHGRTAYYRDILNIAANALNLQPWELLMHPQDAMAIRQMTRAIRVVEHSDALNAVADQQDEAAAAGR